MAQIVKDLDEVGNVFMTMFAEHRYEIFVDLFQNLVDNSPEKTGTLRYNWKFNPYSKAGSEMRENDGSNQPWPREPDEKTYLRANISHFTIYNLTPYLVHVNDGKKGNSANQNFIQRSIAQTQNKF